MTRSPVSTFQIRITPGWYLYHTTLGDDPGAVGKPLVATFGGEGITWSEVKSAKEPKVKTDADLGFDVLIHKTKVIFHAAGKLAPRITARRLPRAPGSAAPPRRRHRTPPPPRAG